MDVQHKPVHFTGLNGLRAIAALAVVWSHTTLALRSFHLDPYLFGADQDGNPKGLALAGFGVSIFFTLSGFLITYLLLVEQKVAGTVDVPKFYVRRILRIWPLYYLYIVVIIIVAWMLGWSVDWSSLYFYLFYMANIPFILGTTISLLAHYWSLGVEEQFYLFWPWVVCKISRHFIPVLTSAIFVLMAIKVLVHVLFPGSLAEVAIHVTRFHCMMIGASGAVFYHRKDISMIRMIDNKLCQTICWALILLATVNRFHIASIIDNEIISAVTLCIIVGQIGIVNRVINLEGKVFDFLGRISYGVYVIHPLVILLFSLAFGNLALPVRLKYAVVYLGITSLTIGIACVSYAYFENYFLKLKKNFTIVKSSDDRVDNEEG